MIIVVGAGPAGLMAAITAKRQGKEVIILEKNKKAGRKLAITGKGRCNLTNCVDPSILLDQFSENKKFLLGPLKQFSNEDTVNFFENLGVPLKIERGGRVFPESDQAIDVVNSLIKEVQRLKIKIYYNEGVVKLLKTDENTVEGVITCNDLLFKGAVVVATGGLSYPQTGSTGDGYFMAESVGHQVVKTFPSLVPLKGKDPYFFTLQGLSLKNVQATSRVNGKVLDSFFGEMLFTHFGLSGPLILSLSRNIVPKLMEKSNEIIVSIDLKPALSEEVLDKRLLKDFEEFANKSFKNALDKLLPKKLIPVIIDLSKIDKEKKCHQITKDERKKLGQLLKNLEIGIMGNRGYEEAIVTRGGVSLKEVYPKTMESKKIKGLYFCGEVLDLDAFTGGYNLQSAFSTGYVVGNMIEG